MQPAEREIEVRVAFSGGVGGMDAAVKPTRTYSRRPLAYAIRTAILAQRGRRVTPRNDQLDAMLLPATENGVDLRNGVGYGYVRRLIDHDLQNAA